jgi:hypothetical protein
MADLKPLGSEKLNADEKLKRILELTYYNEKNKKTTSSKPELVKESKTGCVYGIVREKDGYYVKSGLNESSLDYIGGMFMKNKNKFSSYSEALKRLELLKGQEELNEATKYVLKPSSPKTESPLSDPAADAPIAPPMEPSAEPAPAPDMPSDMEMPAPESELEPSPESSEGGEESAESKRSDYMAEVQKFAGKLGQELRDQHMKMESDDIKYVLNMIISAVDLDKLDLEDLEEIGKKFDRDEEEEGGEEVPAEEPSMEDEVPSEEPTTDKELGEEDVTMDALERFINAPIDGGEISGEIDLSKYADLENEQYDEYVPDPDSAYEDRTHLDYDPMDDYRMDDRPSRMYDDEDEEEMDDEEVELDLDEIKKEISNSINTTLGKYFK